MPPRKPVDIAPWYRWSPRDFAGDPEVWRLQRKWGRVGPDRYRDLLDLLWLERGIPCDPVETAEAIACEDVDMVADIMARLFTIRKCNRLWNRRLRSEFADALVKIRNARHAGKASGKARQAKVKQRSTGVGRRLTDRRESVDSSPSPSPSPPPSLRSGGGSASPLEDEETLAAWDAIREAWDAHCWSVLGPPSAWDVSMASMLRRRLDEDENWPSDACEAIQRIPASDRLSGRSGGWRASLRWLVNPGNVAKVLEGSNFGLDQEGHSRELDDEPPKPGGDFYRKVEPGLECKADCELCGGSAKVPSDRSPDGEEQCLNATFTEEEEKKRKDALKEVRDWRESKLKAGEKEEPEE